MGYPINSIAILLGLVAVQISIHIFFWSMKEWFDMRLFAFQHLLLKLSFSKVEEEAYQEVALEPTFLKGYLSMKQNQIPDIQVILKEFYF
jgi:hypothetical protein